MQRHRISPRPNWEQQVSQQGLTYHTSDEGPYWDESICYSFTPREIAELEYATNQLNTFCMEAVQHVLDENRLGEFGIPEEFHNWIGQSWEDSQLQLYGRFDFVYDGKSPPKLLEFNADTPTSLVEASVVQWFWMGDYSKRLGKPLDQFNSVHEKLISRLKLFTHKRWGFACYTENPEDLMNTVYLMDVASQAGIDPVLLDVEQISWDGTDFTTPEGQALWQIFKLYPWEWMLGEEFGPHLRTSATQWCEPPWKMLLSNKMILAVLYEMFPDCPYLLPAHREPFGDTYVRKPTLSREGANVAVVHQGSEILTREGSYGAPFVYQQFCPLPVFDDCYPVVGSWVVGEDAAGIGIREDRTLVTGNMSRFVPHYIG